MCYNCEGEIDLDVIVCPYCAADLREEKPEQQRPTYHQSASVKNLNTQQSLYPPPYSPKTAEEPVPEEPALVASVEEEPARPIFGPILLLTLGAQLLLLGVFLCLFSHKGVLVLKWDARHWFLYLFASLPFLIFGYKKL